MNKLKEQKRKTFILIIIIFIIIIFLFLMKKNSQNDFQDELIFFKLFSSSKQKENSDLFLEQNLENSVYIFQVSYKNIDFKDIYLGDTIKQNTLVYEKIAPRNRRRI